jgi:NADH-quinone oxidoreductase subunit L
MALTPLALVLPLCGFVVIGLLAMRLPQLIAATIGCGAVFVSFVIALVSFLSQRVGRPYHQELWRWVTAGSLDIRLGIYVDHLSSVMLLTITGVGFLIHVYSVGYMENDPGFNRYFSFMSLFIFFMSLLVMADSFLLLLIGWGGVGLASFLLIGFWYQRPAAMAAARKAFVINVIGDFGLMIAIFLLLGKLGTLQFTRVLVPAQFSPTDRVTTIIALMLLVAAAAKSAQLPLHAWLPDAMEGPTPVSALIHAATMVTAGVYLVARCHVLFAAAPAAEIVLVAIGVASGLYAATTALAQYDIKRVLAYSTISQLGFMFMAEGVGADTEAVFYLVTHAFSKALLFMAAGGVIHALGGEQDLRRMGGLRRKLPITFWSFIIAGLTLSAMPPFAAFWSKEAILGALLARATGGDANPWYYALWGVGLTTAFLTALYTFRLVFSIFFGQARVQGEGRFVHEVDNAMAIPMGALLVLCACGGFVGTPVSDAIGAFLEPAVGTTIPLRDTQLLAVSLSAGTLAALLGIVLAWSRYGARKITFRSTLNPIHRLVAHAYYLDQIGDVVIVRPVLALSGKLNVAIEFITLGGSAQKIGWLVQRASYWLRRSQTGYVRSYLVALLTGAILVLVFVMLHPFGP